MINILLSLTFLLLNLADSILTKNVLDKGGVELNPVLKYLFKTPELTRIAWIVKGLVSVGSVSILWWFADWNVYHTHLLTVLIVLNLMYVYVVYHNIKVWLKVKNR